MRLLAFTLWFVGCQSWKFGNAFPKTLKLFVFFYFNLFCAMKIMNLRILDDN